MQSWKLGGLLIALIGAQLTGCVSTEAYHGLEEQYLAERSRADKLAAEMQAIREQMAAQALAAQRAEERVAELERKLADADKLLALGNDRLAKMQADLSDARLQYEALQQQHRGVSNRLDTVMKDLAKMEGIDYSAEQGKLALSNELLFSSGESFLSQRGREALTRFAAALRESEEHLRIVGHTDSDPVSRTSTVWKHGNWSLSAGRAIEVLSVLEAAGVSGSRLQFGGHGPHRPVASNETSAGKGKNRRVEIYVLPARPAGKTR